MKHRIRDFENFIEYFEKFFRDFVNRIGNFKIRIR